MRPPPKFDLLPLVLSSFRSAAATAAGRSRLVVFPDALDALPHSISLGATDATDDNLAPLTTTLRGAGHLVSSAMRLTRDGAAYVLCHRYTGVESWALRGFDITAHAALSDIEGLRSRVARSHTSRFWRSVSPGAARARDLRPLLALRLLLVAVAHLTDLPIRFRDGSPCHSPDISAGDLPVTLHLFAPPTFYEV